MTMLLKLVLITLEACPLHVNAMDHLLHHCYFEKRRIQGLEPSPHHMLPLFHFFTPPFPFFISLQLTQH